MKHPIITISVVVVLVTGITANIMREHKAKKQEKIKHEQPR